MTWQALNHSQQLLKLIPAGTKHTNIDKSCNEFSTTARLIYKHGSMCRTTRVCQSSKFQNLQYLKDFGLHCHRLPLRTYTVIWGHSMGLESEEVLSSSRKELKRHVRSSPSSVTGEHLESGWTNTKQRQTFQNTIIVVTQFSRIHSNPHRAESQRESHTPIHVVL